VVRNVHMEDAPPCCVVQRRSVANCPPFTDLPCDVAVCVLVWLFRGMLTFVSAVPRYSTRGHEL